jgi:biopolymer transport protein ExbB/TolQ
MLGLSFVELLKVGGPVLLVLIACSVLSLAIAIDRFIYYSKRSALSRTNFMKSVRENLEKGMWEKAAVLAKSANTPFANVVLAGLSVVQYDDTIVEDAVQREILIQAEDLEKRTATLGTIGSTAVYIGLLGTVWGIMRTFQDIHHAGSGGIQVVIKGISEALVCTAAGLLVAIPALVIYNYFTKRIHRFVLDMDLCASEIASLIKIHKNSKSNEKKI